jgi:conjugal transfer pilus assembly protein TraV
MISMAFSARLLACACLAALTTGCATFGTNVEGDFSCRAPKGDCAPSHVIDGRATGTLDTNGPAQAQPRVPVGVAAGDTTRTAERTLRIVFPAHVDASGTLHDEAVAWAVVENPRWAAELRRKAGDEPAPPLMRQLRRQLKAAQAKAGQADEEVSQKPDAFDPASPFSLASPPPEDVPVASPLVLPSTAREAVAGAKAPAVEGFDMPPPHDRTPRPSPDTAAMTFPSVEAIEAAKSAVRPSGAATPDKERK